MKPVCVPCQRFFRADKNGLPFVEAMPKPGIRSAEIGTGAPDQWTPYKLWTGDRWTCDGCGASIVVGVSRDPIAEHYQPNFAELVTRAGATLQVNDC